MKTISDIKGLGIGDKAAVVIQNKGKKSTEVSGIVSGLTVLDSGQAGITFTGLTQWIWLDDNMTVTWVK